MLKLLVTAATSFALLASVVVAASAGPPGEPHPLAAVEETMLGGASFDLDVAGGSSPLGSDVAFELGPSAGVLRPMNGASFSRAGDSASIAYDACQHATYGVRSIPVSLAEPETRFCVKTNEKHISAVSFGKTTGATSTSSSTT